jgi:sigma-E factor negative regulatory protein RseA
MSKESLEHLSSLMDGELSRETGLFMARRLSSDGELCGTWKRYHMIRDCIRRQGGLFTFADLSSGIRDALDRDTTRRAESRAARRWLKPVAGLAIAASVALVAIIAIGPGPQTPELIGDVAGDTANQSFASPNPLPAVPISQPASFNPDNRIDRQAANARLNSYLVRHNQLARAAGSQGFVSFVPIVSTQTLGQGTNEEPENAGRANTATADSSDREPAPGRP